MPLVLRGAVPLRRLATLARRGPAKAGLRPAGGPTEWCIVLAPAAGPSMQRLSPSSAGASPLAWPA